MSLITFDTMGTVASIRISGSEVSDQVVDRIRQSCQELEDRFSLYKPESEISRIASKELALPAASEEMLEEYARAISWREQTDGAFTPHRPDGVLDLNGTIKAVAIDRINNLLLKDGIADFSINIGGDICTHGNQDDTISGWINGIVDPLNPTELLSAVTLTESRGCMATSGLSERGEHIWYRPETTKDFIQATVIAEDIITADVLATAIISGGQATLDTVTHRFNIAVLTVSPAGNLQGNALFQELVAR